MSGLDLPATAFAVDAHGKDMGRVVEIGGGGLLLEYRLRHGRGFLWLKGQRLVVTVVEPTTGNKTDMAVEVRYVRSRIASDCVFSN